MNVVLEGVLTVLLMLCYWLEAIVLFFIPARFRSKDVSGHIVLITGAGSGLGRLMAERFARLGCILVLWDIDTSGNEGTLEVVRRAGAQGYCYTCDLSDREQIYNTANQVKADVGDVDILVNNAGIVTGRRFLDCPDKLIQKTMDVNTMAHYWTTKAFLPSMLTRDHGHIVSMASAAGLFGVTGLADYCASKFGAVGFDESLRFELNAMGKHGVHTTVVCPYYINTGMFDGVVSRFPAMLPIQDPDQTVSRIIDAVLTNQHQVIIPRVLYQLYALKGLLPTKAQFVMNKFFGVNESMDSFRGRKKKD